MMTRGFSFASAVALAGALVVLSPGTSQAQRHGGRWDGGRGWDGGRYGDGWGRGWDYGRSYYGWGSGPSYGYYYPRSYYGWGYTPGYYSYNRWQYPNSDYWNYGYTQEYPDGYYSAYPSDMNDSYGSIDQTPNAAHINIHVPPDAKVWFDNQDTQQRGSFRNFVSPSLDPNKDYAYDIKASWTENGREVTRTRHVRVRAGAMVNVDFLRSSRDDRERRYGASDEDFRDEDRDQRDRNRPADRTEEFDRRRDLNQEPVDRGGTRDNLPGTSAPPRTPSSDTTAPADRATTPPTPPSTTPGTTPSSTNPNPSNNKPSNPSSTNSNSSSRPGGQ